MNGFKTDAEVERALMCRMPGCRNRWAVDISHGRVCSDHDATLARSGGTAPPEGVKRHQAPIPLRDAMRPFAEPVDRDDEEYVHDDRP